MLISLLMAFSCGAATVAISIPAASHAAAMPSSAGPQFQYERPPPPRPWLKWLLMVFTKDPNSQSWLAKNRSTDRPFLDGRRRGREEGRKEGRKIITARAHFGEINRVLITRPRQTKVGASPHVQREGRPS